MSANPAKAPSAWEQSFRSWAQPASDTEEQRCESAMKAVRDAIAKSPKLQYRDISVFAQGSYRNNTNTRLESDVDVGILCKDACFVRLPEGMSDADFGLSNAEYTYTQLKKDVGDALSAHFGQASVTRGNKAFDVHANTYRVDADVAAFFEHRRYDKSGRYWSGVQLISDDGSIVVNWPEQHYANGVAKNNATARRYKALTRVLKRLRCEMRDAHITAANPVTGFLIECLVWNVPDKVFGRDTYYEDLRDILVVMFNATKTDENCSEWAEVSDLKYLLRGGLKWSRQQVHDFVIAAWQYVGFK